MIFFVFLGILVLCFLVYLFVSPFKHYNESCEFIAGVSFVFIVMTIAVSLVWMLIGARHNTEVYVRLKKEKVNAKTAISFARSESLGNYYCPKVIEDAHKAVSEYNKHLAKCRGLERSFLWGWATPSDELKRYKFIDIKKELDGVKCQKDRW